MEINTDLQSKEQILEKLSEDMNDAATKWKEVCEKLRRMEVP